ncbi:hypothetical protein ANRL2_01417 [Anaerolineae bacterium]|nr:hypothetical protein ANRL2_01417 [Anaerolineae bacterium]
MKKIFDEKWHPLYGNLPPCIIAPKSQAARCVSIIDDARKIWDEDLKGWTSALKNIIAAHEVRREELEKVTGDKNPNYDERWDTHDTKAVADKLAWAVFVECVHIYQHSVLKDGSASYYRKGNGKVDTKHSLDTVWKDAVSFIKRHLERWGFCREGVEAIPDYAFLAIIAIHEAHSVLQSIYEYKESDEDLLLVEDVQTAASILRQAELLRKELSTVTLTVPFEQAVRLLSGSKDEDKVPPRGPVADMSFKHNPDYTRVSLNGKEYNLTFDKGRLIKVLHEAFKSGSPVLSKKDTMEKAGLQGRFTDLFKTAREVKQALIADENNGRSCRLNI